MTRRNARTRKEARRKILPNDVLEGRVEVSARELYDLIHQVNPTGRGLSRRETVRRYAQKNRLQSYLLLRFGGEEVVVRRTDKEGVVSLDHPSGLSDACHTKVDELTPEARAWVWRHIDLYPAPDPFAVLGEPAEDDLSARIDGTAVDGVTAARRAMAGYDYVTAEMLLGEVLAAAPEDSAEAADASRELVVLKVEKLGLDAEALALGLGRRALDDPDVRGLLALAAARQGEMDTLREYLAGVPSGRRRADVFAVLARSAAQEGDEAGARRWLGEVRDNDPAHEAVAAVEAALGELATSGLPEAEAELEALYGAEGCEAAVAAARELADRWPGSQLARRILREAAEQRRRRIVAAETAAGEAAFEAGRFNKAARHFRAVLAEDAEAPEIAARLAEAVEAAQDRDAEAAFTAVVQLLDAVVSEDDLRHGLLEYMAQEEPLRAAVIEHYRPGKPRDEDSPEDAERRLFFTALIEVETLREHHPYAKAPALVGAVLALRKIGRFLSEQRPDAANELYQRHADYLVHLPRAQGLDDFLVTYEKKIRRNAEVEKFNRAGQLLGEPATFEEGERLMSSVDLDAFEGEEQEKMRQSLAIHQRTMEVKRLSEAYSRHVDSNDLFAARESALEFQKQMEATAEAMDRFPQEGTSPAVKLRGGFDERSVFLEDAIREEWAVEVEDDDLGTIDAERLYPGLLQPCPGDPRAWLTEDRWLHPDGRRLVLANAFVDWLFVRIVDVDSGRVEQRVSLHTPEPLGVPLTTCWDGRQLRIGGALGNVLVLEPENDWRIAEWRCLHEEAVDLDEVRRTVVLPESAYVWTLAGKPGERRAQVIDFRSGRVLRERKGVGHLAVLYGENGPRLLLDGRGGTFLGSAGGQLTPAKPLDRRAMKAAAADGDAFVAVLQEDGGASLARFESSSGDWEKVEETEVALAWRHSEARMTSAAGVVYLLYNDKEGEQRLTAYDAVSLAELYTLRVPLRSTLAGDCQARFALLLYDSARGSEVVRLGRGAPSLRWSWRPKSERTLVNASAHTNCVLGPFEAMRPGMLDGFLSSDRAPWRRKFFRDMVRRDSKETLLLLGYKIFLSKDPFANDYLHAYAERFGEDEADFGLLVADGTCRLAEQQNLAEEWEKALDILRSIDVDKLTDYKRHYYHMLGLAALHNRYDASEIFAKGLELEDEKCSCPLEQLAEMAEKAQSWPPPPEHWDSDKSWTKQLMGMLRAATYYMKEEQDDELCAVLERPLTWLAAERECLLRLAAVPAPPEPESAAFRMRLNLAFFLELLETETSRRVVYPGISSLPAALESYARLSRARLNLDASTDPDAVDTFLAEIRSVEVPEPPEERPEP